MKIFTFATGALTAILSFPISDNAVWAIEVPAAPATAQVSNAANFYREAMSSFTPLSDEDEKILDSTSDEKLHTKAPAFLARHAATVHLLMQAAEAKECDWGPNDDLSKILPGLNGSRSLAILLVLQARQNTHDHKPSEALDAYLASAALGRSVGRRNILIASLAGMGIEATTIRQIAADLPAISKELASGIPERYARLPRSATFAELLNGDREYAQNHQPPGIAAVMVQGLDPFYKSLGASAHLPPDQFDRAADEEVAKMKLNPMAQTVAPSLKRTHLALSRIRAQEAMLLAASKIVASGTDSAKESRDPFGDGPFEFEKATTGFRLRSALKADGKPETLEVGSRRK